MRISLITETGEIGGAEKLMLVNLVGLKSAGMDFDVICGSDGPMLQSLQNIDISAKVVPLKNVYSISVQSNLFKKPNYFNALRTFFSCLTWTRQLMVEYRRKKPDIVQTVSMLAHVFAGLAAKLSGIRVIAHLQDIVIGTQSSLIYKWLFVAWARYIPDRIVTISPAVTQQFEEYSGIKSKVVQIFNTVEVPEIKWEKFKISEILRIGTVARFTPWKGYDQILLVIEFLRQKGIAFEWHFFGDAALGDANYMRSIKQKVQQSQCPSSVIFEGWTKNLTDIYPKFDLLVHLPIEPEPFGLVIAEAMYFGKDIITSYGGISSYVQQCGGIEVDPLDVEGVGNAIIGYLNNGKQLCDVKKMRELVMEKFSSDVVIPDWVNLYRSILSQ